MINLANKIQNIDIKEEIGENARYFKKLLMHLVSVDQSQ